MFQKPYFELLFGALKEGGVITTQGCTFSYVRVDLVMYFVDILSSASVSLIFGEFSFILLLFSLFPSLSKITLG